MKEHIQDILVGGKPMTKLELANKEIEILHNIIKEVKEWVYKIQLDDKRIEPIISTDELDCILEILDKEYY